MPDEPDVRFLVVHHTASPNDYDPDGAVDLLRGIYRFHTGDRGWPDIAYNFLVDRFGVVYEGRTGSLERAKATDATGGSQGFAQLGCFLGDHSTDPPSEAAVASMGALLGWLAERDAVDLTPGAKVTFVSRGSNRWPVGTEVTTPTIAGHRDMSRTACPGDAAYALVTDGTFARLAAESLASTTTTTSSTTTPSTTTTSTATTTTVTTTTTLPSDDPSSRGPAAVVATVAAAVVGGAIAVRRRRLRPSTGS